MNLSKDFLLLSRNNRTCDKVSNSGAEIPFSYPTYPREKVKIGIVHLGPGAFHRAHQAVYTDNVLNQFGGDWGICGVSMRSAGVRDALSKQDGLYTLVTLDKQIQFQIIGAIKEVLVASEQFDQVIARMTSSDTKIVSLTVTEKGYCLTTDGMLDFSHDDIIHDLANSTHPVSAIGLIVQALKLRRNNNIAAFNVISCDNLPNNGKKLGNAIIAFANKLDKGLAQWIKNSVKFPCTMVDSITPKTEDYIIDQVTKTIGVIDSWPIQREYFTQWIIEDCLGDACPPWHKVGAILSNDIESFEHAKLRILNGLHSSLAYLGSLIGLVSVKEAVDHPALLHFIKRLAFEEIIPTLTPPSGMVLEDYTHSIIERFQNPAIKHLLAQIAWDGSKKMPVRIFDTIIDNITAGRSITLLCISVAAWICFIHQSSIRQIDIIDPRADELGELAHQFNASEKDVTLFLSINELVPTFLLSSAIFKIELTKAYTTLKKLDFNKLTELDL